MSEAAAEYESHQETGEVWLGRLPTHWRLTPVKHLCRFVSGSTPSKDNKQYWVDGYMPWVSPKDMKVPFLTDTRDHLTERALNDTTLQVVEPGALLIVVRSGILQRTIPVAINRVRVTVNQDMRALVFPSLDEARYFSYFVQGHTSALLQIWTKEGATVESIEYEFIANSSVPNPPADEQKQIASFLDYETAKIDALIEKQQQLIALLGEKRQAVISHAVTKGLNPDAPMRDSGVEWLGEVPSHWNFKAIKRLFVQQKRQGFTEREVLSVYRDFGVILKSSRKDNFNKTPEDLSAYQAVNVDDLVINKMKAWQGSLGISPHDGITSPDYVVYVPIHSEHPRFLHYRLRAPSMPNVYLSVSNGIRNAQWRLEPDKFEQLELPLPPPKEQIEISNHLDEQAGKFDDLASASAEFVELLQERRTALISAAVTGKIDVRGWKRPSAAPKKETEMEVA